MRTRLVILCNQFPHLRGDANFVAPELRVLAEAFDEVEVFNYSATRSELMAELPGNVRYRGNLYERAGLRRWAGLLLPTTLFRIVRSLAEERSAGRLRGQLRTSLRAAIAGAKLARDPRLRDSLHSRDTSTTLYSFWGMGAAFALPMLSRPSGGIFVRLHRYDLYDDGDSRIPLRKSLFRVADKILPVSQHGKDYLVATFPTVVDPQKVVVSRLGTIGPAEVHRRTATSPRVIVSCSSLSEIKRVDRILGALAARTWAEPIHWVHFGAGPLFDELKEAAESARLPHVTIELRGQTPNDEVLAYYQRNRVDAFVNVSSSEGVPVSIMEALSFGIPAVATAVGGSPEIVAEEYRSGVLVDANFSDADLAAALDRILGAADSEFEPRTMWEHQCDAKANARLLADILLSTTSIREPSIGAPRRRE